MNTIIRFFRILFENIFLAYKKYDRGFDIDTKNTLMTFNIRFDSPKDTTNNWVNRRDAIIEMIKDKRPAVICMQEVMPHMYKWLYKRLGNIYGAYSVATNKRHTPLEKSPNWFGSGLVIFYDKHRFDAIRSSKDIVEFETDSVGEVVPKIAIAIALIDMETDSVAYFINTHYDYRSGAIRLDSSKKINGFCKDKLMPIYLCGDFNAPIASKELQALDFKYHIPTDLQTQRTFNHFDDTHAVIDFVFSNQELKEYEIVEKNYGIPYISDHYPVVIKLN